MNKYLHNLQKAAYSVDELVSVLSLGRNVIFDLLNSGDLRRVKIGKRTIVPAGSIADFLDSKLAENSAAKPTGAALTRKLAAKGRRAEQASGLKSSEAASSMPIKNEGAWRIRGAQAPETFSSINVSNCIKFITFLQVKIARACIILPVVIEAVR